MGLARDESAGETLTLQGQGVATAPVLPLRWFGQGPAPINNGETPGAMPVAGRGGRSTRVSSRT